MFLIEKKMFLIEEEWYEQRNGIPTGGSLCVQLANIAVFYAVNKLVYSKSNLMKNIIGVKRFIDDGAGFFNGTERTFNKWMDSVNSCLATHGLNIDEYQLEEPNRFVSFLDIKFCFDLDGNLQTDLHIKETDARSYLHFDSSHPNHIFSGIAYSQCMRLRRIINCQERLSVQLDELKKAFIAANYPSHMVDNICKKVLNSERNLDRKQSDENPDNGPLPIRVVSSYGSDTDLVATVKKYETHLQRTRSFSESDELPQENTDPAPVVDKPTATKKVFQFVKKTNSSLRSRVVKLRNIALGHRHGRMKKCGERNCGCCSLLTPEEQFVVNGKKIKTSPGTCKTYNVVYLIRCKLCSKAYVGRSVQLLRSRIGQHRRAFYTVVKGEKVDVTDDDFSIGVHLYHDHGLINRQDFNKNISLCIIDNASPKLLAVREHLYIHLLKTLRPLGLNSNNPFNIPQLLM